MDLRDSPIYYVVMAAALLAVLFAIRPALNPNVPMSRLSRMIRLIAGPVWAVTIVVGMLVRILDRAGQR